MGGPEALISMCVKVGLKGRYTLLTGAIDGLGVTWVPDTITPEDGLSVGNRILEMLSLESEGLHYLNDCLRKCDCGMWRAARILDPT